MGRVYKVNSTAPVFVLHVLGYLNDNMFIYVGIYIDIDIDIYI